MITLEEAIHNVMESEHTDTVQDFYKYHFVHIYIYQDGSSVAMIEDKNDTDNRLIVVQEVHHTTEEV